MMTPEDDGAERPERRRPAVRLVEERTRYLTQIADDKRARPRDRIAAVRALAEIAGLVQRGPDDGPDERPPWRLN